MTILIAANPLAAQSVDEQVLCLDYSQHYILKFPQLLLEPWDYDAELMNIEVELSPIDARSFKLLPVEEHAFAFFTPQQYPEISGWVGHIESKDTVTISGILARGEVAVLFNLQGTCIFDATTPSQIIGLQGVAVFRFNAYDVSSLQNSPLEYHSDWGLEVVESVTHLSLSKRVTYHGPPPESPDVPDFSPDEQVSLPVTSDTHLKALAGHPQRDDFRKVESYDTLFANILHELTWDEIQFSPGIVLLIDNIAVFTHEKQQYIAQSYVEDGSLDFFYEISYNTLQKIPPLFLILLARSKMSEEDLTGLTEVSPRFATMIEAYNAIPPEELANVSLAEFLLKISESLPEDFRQAYFEESPKLRNYVAGSDDENLKTLYPFPAPSHLRRDQSFPIPSETGEIGKETPEEEQGTVIILH